MALTERKRDDCLKQLGYRLQAVDAFNIALRLKLRLDTPRPLEIRLEGKLRIQGNSNAFINPVIEVGVIHCRALLAFLGLYVKNGSLRSNGRQHDSDVGIEHFGLPHVTAKECSVIDAKAVQALAAVFHTANKGVAHITESLGTNDVTLLLIASQLVRELFKVHFYERLNRTPPEVGVTTVAESV